MKLLLENKRAASAVFVASLALGTIALLYRRLSSPSMPLTGQEKNDLENAALKYSPRGFAGRLMASLSRDAGVEKPETPEEWLQWIGTQTDDELHNEAHKIFPSYRERTNLSLEDEKAYAIQTWAMSLQPIFAFIKESSTGWKELLGPIQSSPRQAYTILFTCLASYAGKPIWDWVYNRLPKNMQEITSSSAEHKGKIALIFFVAMAGLYWMMKHEKGIITNLTENFAKSHAPHMGLDLIPSYAEGIKNLFGVIERSEVGESHSNLLWYYPRNTHSTFAGEIGNVLAEMTATGRGSIQGLQVMELDLQLFLTEYRNKDEVFRGWQETMKYLKSPKTLVILKGIDQIKPFLLTQQNHDDDASKHMKQRSHMEAEKILADLIVIDLKRGAFRCLIEMEEGDKQQLQNTNRGLFQLFSAQRAPDINPQELENLCERLYAQSQLASSYAKHDVQELFRHLKPVLDKTPMPPFDLIDILQQGIRDRSSHWRFQKGDVDVSEIQKNEKALNEAEQMKDELLQRVWSHKRMGQSEPRRLLQEVLLVEKIVLPLLKTRDRELKNDVPPSDLVSRAQKKFRRMLGPCTKQEEEMLKALPGKIKHAIKGQDEAIGMICEAIYNWRKVPPLGGKPLVLFLAGAPGVGKSETATQLAFHLNSVYGIIETPAHTHESNVKRINLNRKGQGGILGWDKIKAEILTHLLYEPTSVIILEEWDKMKDEEKGNLLELLDDTKNYVQEPWGYGSTNGPYVDKSSAIFILTSNIGTGEIPKKAQEAIQLGIKDRFVKKEDALPFLSRIDVIVPFQELGSKGIMALVESFLDQYITQGILPQEKRQAVLDSLKLDEQKTIDTRELQHVIQRAVFNAMETEESEFQG